MSKILSQEEIDALLTSASELERAARADVEKNVRESVIVYNFRRPDRVSKEQMRSLHFLHDRFARNVSTSLSAYLRAVTEVSILSVEQFTQDRRRPRRLEFLYSSHGDRGGGRQLRALMASHAPQPHLGRTTVAQSFLEQSNVSIVEEMINMILGQRAYEANSRVVRTAGEMLQQVNNLAR